MDPGPEEEDDFDLFWFIISWCVLILAVCATILSVGGTVKLMQWMFG